MFPLPTHFRSIADDCLACTKGRAAAAAAAAEAAARSALSTPRAFSGGCFSTACARACSRCGSIIVRRLRSVYSALCTDR